MRHHFLALFLLSASTSVAAAQPSFSAVFSPSTVGPGAGARLRFTITNTDASPATGLAFANDLPTGLAISDDPNAWTSCSDAVLSAAAGGSSLSLSGGRVGASTSCEVDVNVVAATNAATYTNTSGALSSSAGNSGMASASLTVDVARPGFALDVAPATVGFGGQVRATYTIDNSANANPAFGLTFAHALPFGVQVAESPELVSTCNGTASASPGSGNVGLSNGFVNPAVNCTIMLNLQVSVAGVVGLSTASLSSNAGSCGIASSMITVPVDKVRLHMVLQDSSVEPGSTTLLQFTLSNMDRANEATELGFSVDLGAALSGLQAVGSPQMGVCGLGSSLSGGALLTFSGGQLDALAQCTFSVEIAIPQAAAGGYYSIESSPVSATINLVQHAGTAAADELHVVYAPTLSATTNDDPALAGDVVTLTITIENTDPSAALTAITFVQDLDQWLPGSAIQSSPANGACGGGSIFTQTSGLTRTWRMIGGTLAAGASCTFDVGLLVPADAPPGTPTFAPETFQATLNAQTVQGRVTPLSLSLLAVPHIGFSLPPGPFAGGDQVQLSVELDYPDQATDSALAVAFNLDLDGALSGLQATGLPLSDVCGAGSSLSGSSSVTLSGGTLAPAEHCTFALTLVLPADAPGGDYELTTTVSATVSGKAVSGGAHSATLHVRRDLGLSLTADDPVSPGDTLNITYKLTNDSADDFTSLSFTHQPGAALSGLVPTGLPVADPCGSGSSLSAAGATGFSLSAGALVAGTSCTFSVSYQVPAGALSQLYTTATTALTGTRAGGGSESFGVASTQFEVQPALSLASAFDRASATLGETVTLQLSLENHSRSQTLTSLALMDNLDAALAGLSALGLPQSDVCGTGSQLSGSSSVSLSGASLNAGESCSISLSLSLPGEATQDTLINTTSALSGTASAAGSVQADATSASLQLLRASLELLQDGAAVAGRQATLQLTLTNADTQNALDEVSWQLDLEGFFAGLTAVGLPSSAVCGEASSLSGSRVVKLREARIEPAATCSLQLPVLIPLDAPRGDTTGSSGTLSIGGGLAISGPDATLTVSSPPPGFARAIAPTDLRQGDSAKLTYTVDNTANPAPIGGLAFSDSLPTGTSFSDPVSSDNSCGGTLALDSATGAIVFSGGSVAASVSCTVEVALVADSAGTQGWSALTLHSDAGDTAIAALSVTIGMAPPGGQPDAGRSDAGVQDAGSTTTGGPKDAGALSDGGGVRPDAGQRDAEAPSSDAGLGNDAGAQGGGGNGCGCRIAGRHGHARDATRGLGLCALFFCLCIRCVRRARRTRSNRRRGS